MLRSLTYIFPSFALSFLLNIPKFLEAKHQIFVEQDEFNQTKEVLIYNVTSLRLDPDYMLYYIHWTRLICTGIIPFTFLSIMNVAIYRQFRKNTLSTVRYRSNSIRKASHMAHILIVIGNKQYFTFNSALPFKPFFQFLFFFSVILHVLF